MGIRPEHLRRFVQMPVVHIRCVPVGMGQGVVDMPVRMSRISQSKIVWVPVGMVAVGVRMAVFVFNRFMRVGVGM